MLCVQEGPIFFRPTYKYIADGSGYVCSLPVSVDSVDDDAPKRKWRVPSWCDRILWKSRPLWGGFQEPNSKKYFQVRHKIHTTLVPTTYTHMIQRSKQMWRHVLPVNVPCN